MLVRFVVRFFACVGVAVTAWGAWVWVSDPRRWREETVAQRWKSVAEPEPEKPRQYYVRAV